jgi:hypothetical protein
MEEGIMEKVVSIKALKYEQMFRTFYSDKNNQELSKHVFFRCDNRMEKVANKSTKIS